MLAKSTNGDAQYDSVYEERDYKRDLDMEMELLMDTKEEQPQPTAVDDGSYYPSATSDAMATYQNISSNIYLGSANGKSLAEESMPCECKFEPGVDDLEAACGDDDMCINRMMFMECIVDDCPCDRYCRNRRFQLRQYARVDVIRTDKKGFGLRALTDLPRNAFIMEYIGEVITNTEFLRRTRAYEMEGLKHYYFMTLKTDEIIDATKKGCMARFINHSCNPNSVTQKWVVGKTMRIGIFTKRAIKAGTELTFDYKFERYGAVAQKCYCGEPDCKGYIGGANKVADEEEEEEEEEVYTPSDLSSVHGYDSLLLEQQPQQQPHQPLRQQKQQHHKHKQQLLGGVEDEDDDNELKGAVTLTQKRMLGRMHRKRESQPLHKPDQVAKFVKRMLDSKCKPKLVKRLLRTLELTNSNTTLGKECLKSFVRLHGLTMLKSWLTEWKMDDEIVEKVLGVLEQLPLANRNGLEDTKMFAEVEKLTGHDNDRIGTLAHSLLESWKELKSVYRIPKRAYVERKDLGESQVGQKRRNSSMDQDSSLLPALKRPPYLSSRDYLDPDDDYYEHLTYHADLTEIQWKMNFLPMPAIPTAPRAMLEPAFAYGLLPGGPAFNMNMMMMAVNGDYDSIAASIMANTMNNDSTMDIQPSLDLTGQIPPASSVYSEDIPTGPSGSYYDMYAAAALYDQAATVAAVTASSTSTTYPPPSSSSSSSSSTHQQKQHMPYMGESGDSIDCQSFPAINTATTTIHTPQSNHSTPTTSTAPKLPLNWCQATTEDGNVYYYHKVTNKTQWSIPVEERSTITSSSSIEGVDSARLEDVVNQAMIRKSHSPSIDGSPTSASHYLHHQQHQPSSLSSTTSTPASRFFDPHHHHHHPSSSSTNIVLPSYSPPSSTTLRNNNDNNSGNGFSIGLDETELKKEVGKVVTRYLSSTKQKALWQGDKHLFKDLARRLTHHIVEREAQSNRKIGGMNTSLRGKIEKFIDIHGASFVDKLKAKKDLHK
ncbi:hypothetical protein BC941DRAFT_448086 [Chlamydoabsidia padenii]|nr:hypothetical protein BC941DRAFT_448086 [Chlamydoabsidia padenii]